LFLGAKIKAFFGRPASKCDSQSCPKNDNKTQSNWRVVWARCSSSPFHYCRLISQALNCDLPSCRFKQWISESLLCGLLGS